MTEWNARQRRLAVGKKSRKHTSKYSSLFKICLRSKPKAGHETITLVAGKFLERIGKIAFCMWTKGLSPPCPLLLRPLGSMQFMDKVSALSFSSMYRFRVVISSPAESIVSISTLRSVCTAEKKDRNDFENSSECFASKDKMTVLKPAPTTSDPMLWRT